MALLVNNARKVLQNAVQDVNKFGIVQKTVRLI